MKSKEEHGENYWISLSDIMTGLMVIFMFISISYMLEVRNKQQEKDAIIEDFKNTKIALYQELLAEFEDDFRPDKWNAVLDEDLSIRFMNEDVLFDYDDDHIRAEFENILDDFFPRYMTIILKEKYKEKIAEVRIEGHTDSQGSYMYNVDLSQRRTKRVLDYLLNNAHSYYNGLDNETRSLVRFWLTANGFSYGRTLDGNSEFTLISGNPEDHLKSRRVEFRIITKTDEVVKRILEKMNES